MRKILVFLLLALLLIPTLSSASEEELKSDIEALKKQVEELKMSSGKAEWPSWLKLNGDLRTRIDSLKGKVHDHTLALPRGTYYNGMPLFYFNAASSINGYDAKNDPIFTNRFRLGIVVNPVENVYATAKLAAYKVWGHQTETPVQGAYFADRANGTFDGSVTHVPEDNILRVDQADFTILKILGKPIWFSVGRRPSTGGVPTHYRRNEEKVGTGGVQGILVDYAFDGTSLGVAPEISGLPGAYAKVCYGKGYDSGFKNLQGNSIKDVTMVGLDIVAIETDALRVEVETNKAFNIFDNMPDAGVRTNLGDIVQYGTTVSGKVANLNLFASAGLSKTEPNNNMFTYGIDNDNDGAPEMTAGAGLLYDAVKEDHSGWAVYVGGRYDVEKTRTKIGAEYNHGSKYWIAFTPAADDMWTSKLGTRGDVYEVYVIQSLNRKPIAKRGQVFFRLGYQYYDFKHTGSNNWVGAPREIAKLTTNDFANGNAQMFQPIDKAYDIYLTLEVVF
ncbi:MAG: DUF3373 family protein [Nitrospirae bacterium]|nr:DUF3373 family protein [Nitrospirota bacterium]